MLPFLLIFSTRKRIFLKRNSFLVNKSILAEVKQALPEVELDILSDLYPDYQIDVAAEQEKLRQVDVIVFQYPLYWYAVPSL